ncbi:MAG TPA: DUF2326 domain-containing protein, partial [Candidatus Pacebacteria bacterium]|nr:DUF2326 domain-containing protein [Candidatus Paceibacterota bacterium]
ESKTDLESEFSNIDTEHVRKIYEEAKALVPTLQKTFNETLSFHNQMVKEKIKYITQEIPELETKINAVKNQLAALLKKESNLLSELNKKGVFEGLETIFSELKTAYEKKGRFEELRSMWITSASKLEKINTELNSINESIGSSDSILQEKIATFNKFFSRMSQQLYGESFVLSTDIGKGGYELNISSISGNLGTGKKKGQIAAFDLSYVEFADAEKIKCLHFVLHDQIENVHDNQISLLIEITNNLNCQLVIPILRDKLPQDVDVKKLEVIRLSQSNKLFKIP